MKSPKQNQNHVPLKRHHLFIFFFSALFVIFLHPLMTLSQGFTLGDYGLQFYPWSQAYAQALKQGFLLLWTPLVGCGFPLFAEGQTGMLYPLNLLMFGFLDFKVAYNASFLVHFMLGAVGTYMYALKRGRSPKGAALAALVFTFGSAYAGCFYNIVSMRSLVWFPFQLYFVEHLIDERRKLGFYGLALVTAQSFLAGFPQTALYACGFTVIYLVLRGREDHLSIKNFRTLILWAGTAMGLALVAALPQVWATWEFAQNSSRTLQDPSFALWGSVPPWSLFNLFMASWGTFLNGRIYIGLMPFLLLFVCPRDPRVRLEWWLVVITLFFALGKFNPVYYLFLKLPMVGLLRNPSKFLFFTAFFLALIAGHGFDVYINAIREKQSKFLKKICKRIYYLSLSFLGVMLGAAVAFHGLRDWIQQMGESYVTRFIVNKSYHRHSLEAYREKLDAMLDLVGQTVNYENPFFWMPFLLAGAFTLLTVLSKTWGWRRVLWMFFIVVSLDLWIYGISYFGAGFIGNVGSFQGKQTVARDWPRDGRILEWPPTLESSLAPNRNMLVPVSHVGLYSPLVDKDYYEVVEATGAVDDSLGHQRPAEDFLQGSEALLRQLGVRYLWTNSDPAPGYKFERHLDGKSLFQNQGITEFDLRLANGQTIKTGWTLKVTKRDPGQITLDVRSKKGGRLVWRERFDPNWIAWIDGKKAQIERVDRIFQTVYLRPGQHEVIFAYKPRSFYVGMWFYIFGFFLITVGFINALWRRAKPSSHSR